MNMRGSIEGVRLCSEIREAVDLYINNLDGRVDNFVQKNGDVDFYHVCDVKAFDELSDRLIHSITYILEKHLETRE